MFDNLDDFKKKAIDNKANLKFKNITIPIGDGEQDFRITGIGEKAINGWQRRRFRSYHYGIYRRFRINLRILK